MNQDQTSYHSKHLYKSRVDRMIDGVCGGFAEYLNIDVILIRILFVTLVFLGGSGVLLYLVGMVLMPVNPEHLNRGMAEQPRRESTSTFFWGSILVVFGIFLLLSNLGLFAFAHIWEMSWGIILSIAVIIVGIAILSRERRMQQQHFNDPAATDASQSSSDFSPRSTLFRSRTNKKMFGVCGGLGDYFHLDPTLIRIIFVIGVLLSGGLVFLVYILLAILMPKEPYPAYSAPQSSQASQSSQDSQSSQASQI